MDPSKNRRCLFHTFADFLLSLNSLEESFSLFMDKVFVFLQLFY